MAQVSIVVNGRTYQLACEDGQEEHLEALAGQVDRHVRGLVRQVGQVGEARLLLMAALLIADEAHELRQGIESGEAVKAPSAGSVDVAADVQRAIEEAEEALARDIDAIAERLEQVADDLAPS